MAKLGEQQLGRNKYGGTELMVRCKDGWLVAEPSGDPGIYDEIAVFLRTDDGRELQLAVVGRDEQEELYGYMRQDEPDWQPMHVYTFDGRDDDVSQWQYVKVDEHSCWYAPKEV